MSQLPPPQTVPPGPRPRTRGLTAAVLVGAVVLGGGTGFVVDRARDVRAVPQVTVSRSASPAASPGVPSGTRSPAPEGPIPTPVALDLPQGAPLAEDEFVAARGKLLQPRLDVARLDGPRPPRRLKTPKGHAVNSPSLSVDRRTVIYVDRTADQIRAIGTDGTGDRALFTKHPAGCKDIGHVSWNRVRQDELVIRCSGAAKRSVLLVITVKGKVVRRLDTGFARVDDPTISPDGTTVAFWRSTTAWVNGGAIVTMPIDGSAEPTELTPERAGRDADPAWSPDGTRILFRRTVKNRGFDVFVQRIGATKATLVLGGPATEEKAAWAPDSERVLVVSNRAGGGRARAAYDLFLVDADGGKARRLGLGAPEVTTPVWATR